MLFLGHNLVESLPTIVHGSLLKNADENPRPVEYRYGPFQALILVVPFADIIVDLPTA